METGITSQCYSEGFLLLCMFNKSSGSVYSVTLGRNAQIQNVEKKVCSYEL